MKHLFRKRLYLGLTKYLKQNIRGLTSIILLISFSFSIVTFYNPAYSYALISTVDEKKMGDKFIKVARKHFHFIEDDEIVKYINDVGYHIVECLPNPLPYNFRFYVIDNPIPNAFAVPGGYIFVHRGIIEIMDNEGELASILAHEIGHIQARHIAKRIARSKVLNITMLAAMLAGMFLGGGAASQALIRGSMATNMSMQLEHSRQDEREADHRGMENLVRAGYDPECMYDAMKKVWNNKWQSGVDIPDYLSTHPGLGERLVYIKALVEVKKKSVPLYKSNKRNGQQLFPFVNAILWGKYHEVNAAEYHFRALIARGDRDGSAHMGLALVLERQGQINGAINSLTKALEMHPKSPLLLTTLARLYFKNNNTRKALELLKLALQINHHFREAYYRLGRCYEEMGQNNLALKNFNKAMEMGYKSPQLKYHIGIVYGRLKQLAPAHEYLGFYYADKDRPNFKLALYHLRKALKLYEGNQSQVEIIEDKIKEIKGEKKGKDDGGKTRAYFFQPQFDKPMP